MTQYVAYFRTSTKRQNLGLDVQSGAVHQFIANEPDAELIGEYQEQESGKDDNRPELERAIMQCKKCKATLLIAKLDRLSRRVSFIFTLKESNVRFRALDMPLVSDCLTLAIYSGLAQQERTLISERTRKALQELRKTRKLGNPHNFTAEEIAKSTATIKHKAASNVNNIQSMAMLKIALSEGMTNLSHIANRLNEQGCKTARGYSHTAESVKRLMRRI
jgi:DNA invertase Pin-like site-specific DNA recombinase